MKNKFSPLCVYIARAQTKPPFSQSKKWSGEQLSEIFANLYDILYHFFVENGYLCDITYRHHDGKGHQSNFTDVCHQMDSIFGWQERSYPNLSDTPICISKL